jgi:predicted nucleic acid-binding protein
VKKKDDKNVIFRRIPSVDYLLESSVIRGFLLTTPRALVLRAIHYVLDELRQKINRAQREDKLPDLALPAVVDQINKQITILSQPRAKEGAGMYMWKTYLLS